MKLARSFFGSSLAAVLIAAPMLARAGSPPCNWQDETCGKNPGGKDPHDPVTPPVTTQPVLPPPPPDPVTPPIQGSKLPPPTIPPPVTEPSTNQIPRPRPGGKPSLGEIIPLPSAPPPTPQPTYTVLPDGRTIITTIDPATGQQVFSEIRNGTSAGTRVTDPAGAAAGAGGGPPDGGHDLITGQGQASPAGAAARGKIVGEVDSSGYSGSAGHAELGRAARDLQNMMNAPLPERGQWGQTARDLHNMMNAPLSERARQAGVDPREIQALVDRRIVQIMGPLDQQATDNKNARERLLNNALTKLKLKDWRAALDDMNSLLTLDPANALALQKRAEAENHLKMYKEAELDGRKAIVLDPTNAGAWQQLAWSLLKQERYQEALEAINRALVLDPSNANDYAMRSCIKEALGDRKGALEDLERAALLDAHYRGKLDAARQGGKIYTPGEDEDSIADMISSSLGGSARLPLALLGLAALLLLAGVGGMVAKFGRAETRRRIAAFTPWATKAAALVSPTGAPMVGKYELGRVIGKGGMGEVYAAKDLSLNRPVAIKKLANLLPEFGEQGRALFIKEAKVVASLHHPSIVDIYDIIERDKEVYLVFEFVGGKTISQLIAEKGRLTAPQALAILKPVCRALAFAHHHNLVHRDLKPANIMVTDEGHLKLMDFGIARSLADAGPVFGAATQTAKPELFARTRTVMGTPAYMPPESDKGMVSKQGDVYSLGVTLYEMVTGKLPFGAKADAGDKIAMRYPPATQVASSLPPGIDSLLKDALQPDPNRRLQTPIEFLSRLKAVVGETVTPL